MECSGEGLVFKTARKTVGSGVCVEVAWHGATAADGSAGVNVGYSDPECPFVHVRDSKDKGRGRVIDITRARWSELVVGTKATQRIDPVEWFGDFAETFTPTEIDAFLDGVLKNEFDLQDSTA